MIQVRNFQSISSSYRPSLRCPSCRQRALFDSFSQYPDLQLLDAPPYSTVGLRYCPNEQCKTLVFFVARNNRVIDSYPAETIDFDSENIPEFIKVPLAEAIICHSHNCFVASAMMVRKTLEALCEEKGASGPNLKEKIKDLGTKIIIPPELLQGLDDLRLLGNDAAHIESKTFDNIGQNEVEVGIEFTKEVLKAVYQYASLLSRLQALKKP